MQNGHYPQEGTNVKPREVWANVTITGTQAEDFMDTASQGCRFGSDHIFVFRFTDADQIQDLTINWDHAGFVK